MRSAAPQEIWEIVKRQKMHALATSSSTHKQHDFTLQQLVTLTKEKFSRPRASNIKRVSDNVRRSMRDLDSLQNQTNGSPIHHREIVAELAPLAEYLAKRLKNRTSGSLDDIAPELPKYAPRIWYLALAYFCADAITLGTYTLDIIWAL